MGEPYVGQIIFAGFYFQPQGWAFCDGRLLSISEYDVLFNLIGTTFGGDGQSTFGLPDLRGRIPVGVGTNPGGTTYSLGQLGGAEQVSIGIPQYPTHNHAFLCLGTPSGSNSPAGAVPGSGQTIYKTNPNASEGMNSAMCQPNTGAQSQPHDNMQPYLVANWIISLYGVYPSQG